MADPEINIAVKADTSQAESALKHLENTAAGAAGTPADTQGSDTLAAGIGRLADACEKGVERIQKLDLDYLHDQFDELKGINAEMGGLGNALDDFGTRLADISSRQAETAEGFRSLQAELTRLSESYTSGKISADEAAAAFAELTDCAGAQLATNKQLCADMRRLAGEQRSLSESKREVLPVFREMQAAAKEELAAFEATSEKKAQLRALEKASLDELYQKVEAYEAKAADARTGGNAASELEAAKAIEATIKAIEKKEATQQRADQAAQAGLERTKRAIVLQHASVERLTRMYDAVRQKYLEAKQAQDVQGEARYLQYAKQVSDALNKKREEADRAARALEQSAKAAEKEAAAQEASAQQMKLSSMKARELTAEIKRLSAARKEAAAAGNVSDYEKLTDDLVRAKKALSEYNNEVNIGKTALLNKAQAGMMVAQQLGGLAQQVRSGSVDMASMASTIMSVSMALKAGLGPIGWVMAAVQGLQMAYKSFCSTAEDVEEKLKALEEAHKRVKQAADTSAKSAADAAAEAKQKEIDKIKETRDEQQKANANFLRQKQEELAAYEQIAAAQDEVKKAQVQARLSKAEDVARQLEETNKAEADLYRAQAQNKAQADLAAIKAAAATRREENAQTIAEEREKMAKADAEAAAECVNAIREEINKSDGLDAAIKDAIIPTSEEIEKLRTQVAELNARKEAFKEYTDKIADSEKIGNIVELALAPIALGAKVTNQALGAGGKTIGARFASYGDELLNSEQNEKARAAKLSDQEEKKLELLQGQLAEHEATLRRIRKSAGLEDVSLEQVAEIAGTRKKRLERLNEELETAKKVKAASDEERIAAENATKQQNELSAIRKNTAHLEQQTEEASRAASLRDAKARQRIANAREEWADVSRRSLAEQQAWLTAQVAQVQEGSELWKKYNDKLESVNRSRVGEELSRLESDLKISTNYARQSGKTQAQVYREDLRILQEKEKQLEHLRTAPGIDAKTEERINRALQSTREQISGLKSAMSQSAANARRWIRETEPPKLQAKNRVVQGALDRLAKTYRLSAARAAKAAEKGDWKAYERAMRTMGNAEKNMGKLAKNSGQVAGYTGAMKNNVRAMADAARSGANSEKEAARAAKQKAGAQKKAADAIEKQRPKEKIENAAQKIAELSSKMNSAQKQMERLSQQVTELRGAIDGLASAAGSAAAAAGNVASAANSAIKSVERRIKACEKSIDKLRR